MNHAKRFLVAFLAGGTVWAAGCAQPSFWSKVKGSMPVGSPRQAAAPAVQQPSPSSAAATGQRQGSIALDQRSRGTSPSTVRQPVVERQPASPVRAVAQKQAGSSEDSASTGQAERTPEQIEVSRMAAARLRERREHPEEAEAIYHEVLAKNPNNGNAWHRLAVACASQAKYEESNQYFDKAFSLAEPTAVMHADRGYCYYLQHELDQAEQHLRQALQLDAQVKGAQNNLGLVLGMKGKFDEALVCFKKAGTEAEAHANMGYIYSQLGALDHANAHYNHALSLNKDLKSAAKAWVQVDEKRRAMHMKKPPTSLADDPNAPDDEPQALAKANSAPASPAARAALDEIEVVDMPKSAVQRHPAVAPTEDEVAIGPGVREPPSVAARDSQLENADETLPESAASVPRALPARQAESPLIVRQPAVRESAPAETQRAIGYDQEADFTPAPIMTPAQYKVRAAGAEMPIRGAPQGMPGQPLENADLGRSEFAPKLNHALPAAQSSRRTAPGAPGLFPQESASPAKREPASGPTARSGEDSPAQVKPVFEDAFAKVRQPPATQWGTTGNNQTNTNTGASFGKSPRTVPGYDFNQQFPTVLGATAIQNPTPPPAPQGAAGTATAPGAGSGSSSPRSLRNWFPAP